MTPKAAFPSRRCCLSVLARTITEWPRSGRRVPARARPRSRRIAAAHPGHAGDDARYDGHVTREPHEQKEGDDPRARPERGAPLPREDRDERPEHGRVGRGVEEQVAKLRRVEAEDEAAERAVAAA